jgi:alpha-galactosidase
MGVSGDALPDEMNAMREWVAATLGVAAPATQQKRAIISCLAQGWETLKYDCSVNSTPLCLKGQRYSTGLGTHADSRILIKLPGPGARFSAIIGVDENEHTINIKTEVTCSVEVDGHELYRSPTLTVVSAPAHIDVDLNGATEITLRVTALKKIFRAHFDWADAFVTLADGTRLVLGDTSFDSAPRFSFKYAGAKSETLLKRWTPTLQSHPVKDGAVLHQIQWNDPELSLQVTCELRAYTDFPAAEWVVRFKNTGNTPTPLIEDIQALDTAFKCPFDAVLHRARGGDEFQRGGDDFSPVADKVLPDQPIRFSCFGGRSSALWMPYFNLEMPGGGVLGGIGWTGQWAMTCERGADSEQKSIRLSAGMEKTHLTLYPGEEIRTPSILLVFWKGNLTHAINLFRRVMLRHYTPQADGKPVQAPLSMAAWGGERASDQLDRMRKSWNNGLKFECYWIDADWFGTEKDGLKLEWGKKVGDWRTNPITYPDGLKPISDLAHQHGMKFLLWYEPERAVAGLPIPNEHPEWFLGSREAGKSLLLNIGNLGPWQYLTDTISNGIRENAMDIYRQDFNFPPLPYWTSNDTPDRQGMTEIRYVEGLYAFLDELLRRHPGPMIDNCASGGLRLDFEMCKRSIPLWRSDAQCFSTYNINQGQTQTYYLARWVPVNAVGLGGRIHDNYFWRSLFSAGLSFPVEQSTGKDDYPFDWYLKLANEYLELRAFYYSDFYPLAGLRNMPETKHLSSPEALVAYQFDRPDLHSGMVMAFRHESCPVAAIDLKLQSLDRNAQYEVVDLDNGKTIVRSGEDLETRGLHVDFANPRESRGYIYSKPDAK